MWPRLQTASGCTDYRRTVAEVVPLCPDGLEYRRSAIDARTKCKGAAAMKKVLILEDEVSIRSFVVINLKRAGYEAIEAGTGMEALEQLKKNPIPVWPFWISCCLISMDLRSAGASGPLISRLALSC